jgi:TM2 domain-containing membrane protein YozV
MTGNYPPQPTIAPKDPNTAFLIELVGGLFGFLGLGYFYIGRTNDGVVRLIIFLLYNIMAYVIIVVGASLTVGILGCICAPIQLAIQLGVAFWSANTLKNAMLGSSGAGIVQPTSNQHPQ